jgi:hypothetical protein
MSDRSTEISRTKSHFFKAAGEKKLPFRLLEHAGNAA